MGDSMSAAIHETKMYNNWKDKLSQGEHDLLDIRQDLMRITKEEKFTRDQIEAIDNIRNEILDIVGGKNHRYELDKNE